MNRAKKIYTTIYLICLMAFTGCGTKISVRPLENNESEISLELELGKTIEETLDTAMSGLTEIEGNENQVNFFDAPSIEKSLAAAGFKNIKITTPARTKLNLSFSGKFDFAESEKNKTCIKLNQDTIKNFSTSFGEEFKSVIDLFMAPVLTDEEMSADEYAELVAVVYGQKVADELMHSSVEFSVVSKNGKSKSYKSPLAELMTLTNEMTLVSE